MGMIHHQIFISVIPWLMTPLWPLHCPYSRSESAEKLDVLSKKLQSVQDIDELTKMVLRVEKKHEMCWLFLRVPRWLISRFLCEAPCSQRVRREEDDPSSHPKDPRRAAARRVQLFDGAGGVCPIARCTFSPIRSTRGSSCLWNAAYFSPCFLAS